MRLVIQGKNIEVTDAIHDYVHQKVGRVIDHFAHRVKNVDVNLSVPRKLRGQPQQIAEVTVYAEGATIRAEEKHESLYASIDLVADKLARQLQKYKDKLQQRPAKAAPGNAFEQAPLSADMIRDREPELPPKVVRNKFFAMPPMTVEEALDNLQLVGHDFYMFHNSETGEINVIYERNHGGYGILQPRLDYRKPIGDANDV
ncbi:ribosome-associated translation inhibitor RaiA [Romeria aff. gracilis LEGE 07310]|uniref:Ribosome hibernation promoting factor n=1 Tax=Vasconcelosia minhoensis LEGE 07310 TaxID=915328 RepID=A0A8J7APM8_9CYAN|nr:ribosome-associated translation inhibitor RaiA [Romeria gracilis]MBE9078249.1 ribosome-associated translation inhibitor RaiA [Romeria aff. gracilis LEGE 07310]